MSHTTESMPESPFTDLGLDERLVAALLSLGYEEPTPIQREAIPPLLAGHDVLGQAATGTGKTAAFALPMLQNIALAGGLDGSERSPVAGLILVPTRELAIQVAEAVHKYGKKLGVRVLPIYGGQSIVQQLRVLKRGVDVVVATPGRALDHIRRSSMDLSKVRMVVLDEADEMLDMGFADDLEAILHAVPTQRQTALFSATLPPRIAAIAQRHLQQPVRVTVARDVSEPGSIPRVRQVAYIVQRQHKVTALGRVLDMEDPSTAIVFCRTRTEVDELTEMLGSRGYRAEALHGGLSQEQRDRVMRRFRAGTSELLVATDVAARGLDIEQISHVINFDVPTSPDAYVHRIGRTGRAGREGVAITLAEPRDHRQLRNIEQHTRQRIPLEAVPTLLDLRARRLELTRGAIREIILSGELDDFRVVIDSLGEEFDITDIAAAAVRMAHESEAGGGDVDDKEIPTATIPSERPKRGPRDDRSPSRNKFAGRDSHGQAGSRAQRDERFARELGGASAAKSERPPRVGRESFDVARVYVGLGRQAGVRPGDLVGAIANEAGLDAKSIGAIDISERFSLVEVPEQSVDDVINALRGTTIRGKRVLARRDRAG